MSHLDLELKNFFRALDFYMDYPDINTKFQLQRHSIRLCNAVSEHDQELEKRITENVLKAISVKVETGNAIKEIKALDKAIKNLGK